MLLVAGIVLVVCGTIGLIFHIQNIKEIQRLEKMEIQRNGLHSV